jgi:hypothetical protein
MAFPRPRGASCGVGLSAAIFLLIPTIHITQSTDIKPATIRKTTRQQKGFPLQSLTQAPAQPPLVRTMSSESDFIAKQ